jgi:sulfoxide reductase heme-binding subunit YedZ
VSGTDPGQHLFWLSSRAFGVVAMVLVSLSVGVGLALAGRVSKRPGMPRKLKGLHESLALAGLLAIAFHGLLLLGDSYLRPGLAGISIPFVLDHRVLWTGLGVIAGWMSAIIVGSFYVRRWVGVKVWRWLHRWTLVVWVLGIAHTLGSGTDAGSIWLIALLALTAAPVAVVGTLRQPWTTTRSATPSTTRTARSTG